MRRRSKPRVVWLPLDSNNRVGPPQGRTINAPTDPSLKFNHIDIFQTTTINEGDQYGTAIALVGDNTNAENFVIGNTNSPGSSFSDLFNSGYRLRRIVGQIAVVMEQGEPPAGAGVGVLRGSICVTAAFQVMRVDNSGLPVDAQAANTMAYNTTENPWIWRRSWFLTNFGSTRGVVWPVGSSNNFGAGSVREGVFVDQKTARIVGPDQRLFLCVTATMLDTTDIDGGTVDTQIGVYHDLRILASLKTSVGNRRNSSR